MPVQKTMEAAVDEMASLIETNGDAQLARDLRELARLDGAGTAVTAGMDILGNRGIVPPAALLKRLAVIAADEDDVDLDLIEAHDVLLDVIKRRRAA